LFVPPSAEALCVTFEAATLPSWRVQDSLGNSEITRELRVVKGRPVQLLLSADRECTLQIPAMRIYAVVMPDRLQRAWFVPVKPGEYEILVRYGTEQYDGKVVVAENKTP
jgi:heme/copper-type cytochrome/quinol oxidase subunit 2